MRIKDFLTDWKAMALAGITAVGLIGAIIQGNDTPPPPPPAQPQPAPKPKPLTPEELKQMQVTRLVYVRNLENEMLDKGMNVDVTASGKTFDVLTIKWALVTKVAAHHMAKSDLLTNAKELGFTKVILTNGFKSELAETWTWDLAK